MSIPEKKNYNLILSVKKFELLHFFITLKILVILLTSTILFYTDTLHPKRFPYILALVDYWKEGLALKSPVIVLKFSNPFKNFK